MIYGYDPVEQIDHINGDRSDNRPENLREATHAENNCNSKARNKLGVKGVCLHGCGKYMAYVKLNGKMEYFGLYLTAEEAKKNRDKRAKVLHGEFFHA
jgi:hypothetical protein